MLLKLSTIRRTVRRYVARDSGVAASTLGRTDVSVAVTTPDWRSTRTGTVPAGVCSVNFPGPTSPPSKTKLGDVLASGDEDFLWTCGGFSGPYSEDLAQTYEGAFGA